MKRCLILLLLALLPAYAAASPGGTDANGGHYNHKTGLYHYHHGYPEHQHENGICPYTGKVWELKIPEYPATLAEWQAQKHPEGETAVIDDETPEGAAAAESEKKASSAVPYAAAGGAAAVAAGAAFFARKRRKDKLAEESVPPMTEPAGEAPAPEAEPEPEMPEDKVIGEDGLPWEKDAYARWQARKLSDPYDSTVPTNYSEPKWGRKYTFCTDADGDEIHTMDCELAFIQINAADPHCPKQDCEKCRPVRPDLRWFEKLKAERQEEE